MNDSNKGSNGPALDGRLTLEQASETLRPEGGERETERCGSKWIFFQTRNLSKTQRLASKEQKKFPFVLYHMRAHQTHPVLTPRFVLRDLTPRSSVELDYNSYRRPQSSPPSMVLVQGGAAAASAARAAPRRPSSAPQTKGRKLSESRSQVNRQRKTRLCACMCALSLLMRLPPVEPAGYRESTPLSLGDY